MTRQPNIDARRRDLFERKFIPEPMSGCWLWTAGRNEHGYGVFWNGTRLEKAHRFAFRADGFYLADDCDLLHSCDTPACVNPQHLTPADAQANVDDMWRKGRATVIRRRGTSQTQAKLSDTTAAEIRLLWATGAYQQRELGHKFGVSQTTVWNVIHRRNWFAESGVIVETGRSK